MSTKRVITKAATSILRIFFHLPTTSSSRPSSASHGISVFNDCCWVSLPQSYPNLIILQAPDPILPGWQKLTQLHPTLDWSLQTQSQVEQHEPNTAAQLHAGCQKRHNLSAMAGALSPPTFSPCHTGPALTLAFETQLEVVEFPSLCPVQQQHRFHHDHTTGLGVPTGSTPCLQESRMYHKGCMPGLPCCHVTAHLPAFELLCFPRNRRRKNEGKFT